MKTLKIDFVSTGYIVLMFFFLYNVFFNNSIMTALVDGFIIAPILFVMIKRKKIKVRVQSMMYMIYAIYIVIEIITHGTNTHLFSAITLYLICPLLPIVVQMTGAGTSLRKVDLDKGMRFAVYLGLPVVAGAFYEFLTKRYIVSGMDMAKVLRSFDGGKMYGIIRARSFTSSFLTLGDILGILSLFCLYLYKTTHKRRYIIFEILYIAGVFTPSSRGSLVSVIVAYIVYFYFDVLSAKKNTVKKLLLPVAAVILILLVIFIGSKNEIIGYWLSRFRLVGDVLEKGLVAFQVENRYRYARWFNNLGTFTESVPNMLFGTGLLSAWYDSAMGVTESGLIEHLVELGITGCVLYYGMIFCTVAEWLKIRKHCNSKCGDILFAASLILFVHDIILQVSTSAGSSILIWLMFAMVTAETNLQKERVCLHGGNVNDRTSRAVNT